MRAMKASARHGPVRPKSSSVEDALGRPRHFPDFVKASRLLSWLCGDSRTRQLVLERHDRGCRSANMRDADRAATGFLKE